MTTKENSEFPASGLSWYWGNKNNSHESGRTLSRYFRSQRSLLKIRRKKMGILILTLSSVSHPASAPQFLVITLEWRVLKKILLNMYIIYVYVYRRYCCAGCNFCMGSKCSYCHRFLLLDRCVDKGWPDWHIGQVLSNSR